MPANPFDPNSQGSPFSPPPTAGFTPPSWWNGFIYSGFWNQNLPAGGQEWLTRQGQSAFGPFGSFFQTVLPTLGGQYQNAALQSPGLNFLDWLDGQRPELENQFGAARARSTRLPTPRRTM